MKQRCAQYDQTAIEAVRTKQQDDIQLQTSQNKVIKLEKLCRVMQANNRDHKTEKTTISATSSSPDVECPGIDNGGTGENQ